METQIRPHPAPPHSSKTSKTATQVRCKKKCTLREANEQEEEEVEGDKEEGAVAVGGGDGAVEVFGWINIQRGLLEGTEWEPASQPATASQPQQPPSLQFSIV